MAYLLEHALTHYANMPPHPHTLLAEATMQQATTIKKTIIFKEYKVPTHKEDMVTTPFIYNQWVPKPDTTWVTPANIFYTRVLGGALVSEDVFMAKMNEIR